jgi:hypothetical protein
MSNVASFFTVSGGYALCNQLGCQKKYVFLKGHGTGTLTQHMEKHHTALFFKMNSSPAPAPAAVCAAAAASSSSSSLKLPSPMDLREDDNCSNTTSAEVGRHKRISASSEFTSPPAKRNATYTQRNIGCLLASGTPLVEHTALYFATNHIAYNVADTPSFKSFCAALREHSDTRLPSRRALKAGVSVLADKLRSQVIERIKGGRAPVTIAIDGWTNVRHTKVTNVLLLCSGIAYYWCSISNTYDANTADWLDMKITPILEKLKPLGIRFSALVADNEAVNDALFNRLFTSFPFLIRIPCAAHTIQLVVKQIMLITKFENTLNTVTEILSHFEKKKEDRQKLRSFQQLQGKHEYPLVKPCDTRWNSQLLACDRLLLLLSPSWDLRRGKSNSDEGPRLVLGTTRGIHRFTGTNQHAPCSGTIQPIGRMGSSIFTSQYHCSSPSHYYCQ